MTTTTASKSDALATLARTWGDRDSTERAERLSLLVHPSLTGIELADAFADYRDALLNAAGLETQEICWQDYEPELTGPGRQEQAWLDACGEVDAALRTLTNGPRRGAGETGELT
jgi:hypothetical protein